MNRTQVIDRLNRFEGRVLHMYQCTGGKVTVGVGHAIETAEDAEALEWDNAATVADDYARVATAAPDQVASAYAQLSACRMSDEEIDRLCDLDVIDFEEQLKGAFPAWATYPEPVQQALFDMAFNLGIAGLKKFVNMLAAVDISDWEKAATESHRKGIAESRNAETEQLFLSATA
jgi:GH24 family phage-related lysozyme (muramidase)